MPHELVSPETLGQLVGEILDYLEKKDIVRGDLDLRICEKPSISFCVSQTSILLQRQQLQRLTHPLVDCTD
jgi:hypothetical protein